MVVVSSWVLVCNQGALYVVPSSDKLVAMNLSLFEAATSSAPVSEIQIWCDGACSGNPGLGGWGAIVEEDGTFAQTTNNQMELQAVIETLQSTLMAKDNHLVSFAG